MGIQNGPAPEGRVTGGDLLEVRRRLQAVILDRNSLQVQLQESERLRTEAFHACETMRLERDEWKAAVEYQQQQATQLRLQVAALEASVGQEQGVSKTLRQQLADADAQIRHFEKINDTRDELEHKNKELQAQLDAAKNEASKTGWVVVGNHLPNREQLDAEIVRLTGNWGREIDASKALQQQVAELQAQLDAAAVTPAQQLNGDLWRAQLQMKDLTTARDAAFKEIRELRQKRDELQAQLDAVRETAENNYAKWQQEAVTREHFGQQIAELQAQLDAAAVTPAQQPDGNAALRPERVRRMIGEIRGWYACVECLGEQSAETWEQIGALLGHLQQEAD